MNNISICGNSGSSIKLIENGVIRKISPSIEYNERLLKQLRKQFLFNDEKGFLFSPEILNIGKEMDSNLVFGDMKYISSASYIDFFTRESVENIYDTFNILCNFIIQNLSKSNKKVVPKETFNKWKSFYAFKEYEYFLGYCHGDFTFSNMLFAKPNKIYLIDFLDTFLESPYQDLIKLRQDTKFHWSLYLVKESSYDKIKILQILKILDQLLCENFSYIFNTAEFKQLEICNYLRIIPYCKSTKLKDFVNNILKEIYE